MAESNEVQSKSSKSKPPKSVKESAAEGFEAGYKKALAKGVEEVVTKGVIDEAFKGFKTKRRITIKIYNETKQKLDRGSSYFYGGTSDDFLPESIKPNEDITFCARKTNLALCMRGCIGVIGYEIDEEFAVAIYFSVPYVNHVFGKNKWNVMLVEERKVTEDTYKALSSNHPLNGDMCWVDQKIKIHGSNDESHKYRVIGCMSSSAKSVLEVHITDATTSGDHE